MCVIMMQFKTNFPIDCKKYGKKKKQQQQQHDLAMIHSIIFEET